MTEQTGATENAPNADEAAAAAAAAATSEAAKVVTQDDPAGGEGVKPEGAASPFAELQDADTRQWLEKRGVKDIASLAKQAREQDKLLGNAIRIPDKDATPEEKAAFLDKLGRPEKPEGYEFKALEGLPENLPYNADRDGAYASKAHELGLTKAQAAGLRSWFVDETVGDANQSATAQAAMHAETAKGETAKLTKLWGPLDGEQMKAQLSYADKALREVGGDEVLKEFQRVGLVGSEGNMILSAPIAVMMARFGAAVFKEDDVLRGDAAKLNNPFEGAGNMTAQMRMIRADEAQARSFIAAAGKKPADFGLKDR